MQRWNIEQAASGEGKIAIVTGANSGIGFETTLALARKGFEVIMACRDMRKAEDAKSKILHLYPGAKITMMKLDLSILDDVNRFAGLYLNNYQRLDLLVNNAGIMMPPYKTTADGFESQLATNYLGHFALTGLLLPLLVRTLHSRVITLSSLSYKWARIQFDDLNAKKKYSRTKAYGQSKRACLMFAFELQRRLTDKNFSTLSIAAHPGLSKTNLDQYFPSFIRPLGSLFLQSAQMGSLPVLYAALNEELRGGEFIGPGGFRQMRGYPTVVGSDEYSNNKQIAQQLWQASEEITKIKYLSSN